MEITEPNEAFALALGYFLEERGSYEDATETADAFSMYYAHNLCGATMSDVITALRSGDWR